MAELKPGPVPMYSQLRDAMREDILKGIYAPHDRLPSEAELGSRHSISRITVRQALGELQNEGLIFKVAGKGAFVSQPKAAQDVTTLMGFDEAMSARGHKTRNDVLSFDEVRADEAVARALKIEPGAFVSKIQRLRFLDNVPVSVDESYLPLGIGRQLENKDLGSRDIFLIIENDLSTPLGEAKLSIEAALPDEGLARLLGIDTQDPILRIARLTHDADGRPIDFEYLHYRSDRFRYEFSTNRRRSSSPSQASSDSSHAAD